MMSGPYHQPKRVHTANIPLPSRECWGPEPPPDRPFICIAQQIGAECPNLPQRLAEILNQSGLHGTDWSHWDQEIIEKVAREYQLPAELIASFDTSNYSWVDDILGGIAGRPDEMVIFHRLKETVCGLAAMGHVILIGHGSTFMTHGMAGGVRVRLIAPMNVRVATVAARLNTSPHQATRSIRRYDRRRRKFFARFWPDRPLTPEAFAAVLNITELDEERLIRAVAAMVPAEYGTVLH